jgi:DNA-binding Xre family transcriptional regulator
MDTETGLLVFENFMTHLHVDHAMDDTVMLQRRDVQLEKIMNLKHESGSLGETKLWKFEDLLEVCDALGCNVTDHTKRLYFMEKFNTEIFQQIIWLWKRKGSPFPMTCCRVESLYCLNVI